MRGPAASSFILSTLLAVSACGDVKTTTPDGSVSDVDAPIDGAGMVTLTVTRTGAGTVTSAPTGLDCGATCTLQVAPGTEVTLTAAPDASAVFAGWGGACHGASPTCTITVDADTTVSALFGTAMRNVTVMVSGNGTGTVVSSVGGISCPGTCSASVAHGSQITLTATPQGTSQFLGWSGGTCTGAGPCTFTVDRDVTVNAPFGLDYTVVVTKSGNGAGSGTVTSSPTGIACGSTCSQTFPNGTMVTLTATAAANARFTGWSGSSCSGTGTCVVTVSSALAVDAEFTLRTYTLGVTVGGTGAGVVSSTPAGITCGNGNTACSAAYDHGEVVMLTAAASATSTFTGWTGACSGAGTCMVTMDQARDVNAEFTRNQYTLTVDKSGDGASFATVTSSPAGINCGGDCAESYAAGTSVTLTAGNLTGLTFQGWGTPCSGTGPCTITVNGATSVLAAFTTNLYTVSAASSAVGGATGGVISTPAGINCGGGGTDCSEPYPYGSSVALTAVSGANSVFNGWTGNAGCTTNPCVLSVPAMAVSAVANFITGTYDTTITSSPLTTTADPSATFGFASVPAGAINFECSIDDGPFTACASPTTYTGLAATNHRFKVRVNQSGTADATPATFDWRITGGNPPRLPDSITAMCTDGATAVPCPGGIAGQDGNYRLNVPVYTATAETVTDSVTGLMWQRTVASASNYAGAIAYCDDLTLGGFSDWRLPSRFELITLVDAQRTVPPFDTTAFPGIPQNSNMRSRTRVAGSMTTAWSISTNYARVAPVQDSDTEPVRCVRLSQGGGVLTSHSLNAVSDGRTGLIWQKTASAAMTWANALAYCESLSLDGNSDWRLPSLKELATIVDDTVTNPSISALFTDRPAEGFWTSSPVPTVPTAAYAISFNTGGSIGIDNPHTSSFRARCVR